MGLREAVQVSSVKDHTMDRRKWALGTTLLLVVLAASLVWQRCAVANLLVASGSTRLVSLAMKVGLNLDARCNGACPIFKAVRASDETMLRYLIAAKVNVDVRDGFSATPLILAVEENEPEMVADLIAAGADVNAIDSSGFSALRHAVRKNHADLAEQLIRAGANANIADDSGITPLMQAANDGNLQLAQILLSHGAALAQVAKTGHPAVDYLRQGHDPALAVLLRTVYFVPIGQAPLAEIEQLVGYYRERFGIDIKVLPALGLTPNDIDASRQQLIAENLVTSMLRAHPEYAGNSSAILIGITAHDIYPRQFGWRFVFGWRDGQRNAAVASTARMNLHYYGEPAEEATMIKRLRKTITKDLGILLFERSPSNNPKSVLYDGIGGIQELDEVGDDF
jgi:predicted Zn-dependent protease